MYSASVWEALIGDIISTRLFTLSSNVVGIGIIGFTGLLRDDVQ